MDGVGEPRLVEGVHQLLLGAVLHPGKEVPGWQHLHRPIRKKFSNPDIQVCQVVQYLPGGVHGGVVVAAYVGAVAG